MCGHHRFCSRLLARPGVLQRMLDVCSGLTFCPLRLAVESGSAESVRLLLHAGFKPMGCRQSREDSVPPLIRLAAASGNIMVSFEPLYTLAVECFAHSLRCATGDASTAELGAQIPASGGHRFA